MEIKTIIETFLLLMIPVVFILNLIKLFVQDNPNILETIAWMILSFITGPIIGVLILVALMALLGFYSMAIIISPLDLIFKQELRTLKTLNNHIYQLISDLF